MAESIFKFGDKFGYESPFGDWRKKMQEEAEKRKVELKILKIEEPVDNKGKVLKAVSRNHTYTYFVTFNRVPLNEEIHKIKWAVSYDNSKAKDAFYLFSGGTIKHGKLQVNIQIRKGTEKFKIYAYNTSFPNDEVFVEIFFKKVFTFFIGGAADKNPYHGLKATNIVENKVRRPFNKYLNNFSFSQDYDSEYLGFEEVFKQKIYTTVLPLIPNKDTTIINIVGHSLGGWNGAHLSQILTDKGYEVDLLVTLDPVGVGKIVQAISDIYWNFPFPKSKFWINILVYYPDDYDITDLIADLGAQWIPTKPEPDIFVTTEHNHAEAGKMFTQNLEREYQYGYTGTSLHDYIQDGLTAFRYLLAHIEKHLNTP